MVCLRKVKHWWDAVELHMPTSHISTLIEELLLSQAATGNHKWFVSAKSNIAGMHAVKLCDLLYILFYCSSV